MAGQKLFLLLALLDTMVTDLELTFPPFDSLKSNKVTSV